MKREELLDRLIDRHDYQGNRRPVSNNEITASLAAAEALTQLQKINVPPEFAHRLELSIRDRARSQGVLQQNGRSISTRPLRGSAKTHLLPHRRTWVAVGIAAMLVLAFISLLTAFAVSLPGDPLYNLKQARDQFILASHNNPQDYASVEIEQLHSALSDLSAAVNAGRDDNTIKQALNIVATKTNDSQKAVAALPAGSDHDTAQQNLDNALAEENQTLRHLLNQMDWSMRLDFTQQLGVLGDSVPKVTHVVVSIQINGTLLITLTGTNFAPQAQLMINGKSMGTVTQSTSGQLVAVISSSQLPPGTYAFGILNPDGTAAQMLLGYDRYEHERDH